MSCVSDAISIDSGPFGQCVRSAARPPVPAHASLSSWKVTHSSAAYRRSATLEFPSTCPHGRMPSGAIVAETRESFLTSVSSYSPTQLPFVIARTFLRLDQKTHRPSQIAQGLVSLPRTNFPHGFTTSSGSGDASYAFRRPVPSSLPESDNKCSRGFST